MPVSGKLRVVLMWHMHQPDYRAADSHFYHQPWTYLHSIKDYVDMAMHLEAHPECKVVVNFTPILLEQIDDYCCQIKAYLKNKQPLRDVLLSALTAEKISADLVEREKIIQWCLRSHKENTIQRFSAYHELVKIADNLADNPRAILYLNQQYFTQKNSYKAKSFIIVA